jgi:MFS family permease
VGIVVEVPLGAVADRFSRRGALVAAALLQAVGYVLWISFPGYPAFAAGFVLWGLGGSFGSGALEALLYDGMARGGAEDHYPRVYSRVTAVGLLAQIPAAVAATLLYATGGYALVGWASVGSCLAAAAVASRLPDARPEPVVAAPTVGGTAGDDRPDDRGEVGGADDPDDEPGYLAVLRCGLSEAARRPAVRGAVVAVAILGGLDGLEEYFPLLAQDWGVSTSLVPLAVLGIPLVGAAGAALGGPASRLRPRSLGLLLGGGVLVFAAAGVLRRPVGVAGIALAYGLYQLVLVVTDARLQARIEGPARATVTSVASLGTELTAVVLYVAWALTDPVLVALLGLAIAAALPRLLQPRPAHDDTAVRPPVRPSVRPPVRPPRRSRRE